MCSFHPRDFAVDDTVVDTSNGWLVPLSATAVSHETDWRYGVADSIRGFGSLDPGSNPGTSACSVLLGHGVMESILVCDTFDLGSTPSVPANSTHGGAKTQHRR